MAQTISEVRVPDPHNDPWRQRRPWSFKQQAPAGRGSVVNRVAPAAVCGDDLAGDQSTAFRCEIADSDCRDVDLRLFDAGGDDPASDPLYRVGVVVLSGQWGTLHAEIKISSFEIEPCHVGVGVCGDPDQSGSSAAEQVLADHHLVSDWTSHADEDTLPPHFEARSNASGLTPPRCLCRRD